MSSPHEKLLHALRFDQTTFAGAPRWREIRFERELAAEDVAAFLKGELSGPAVIVLEESAFERLRLVACADDGGGLLENLGRQHVTERTGQTTSLFQEIGIPRRHVGLLTRYVDAKRVRGAIHAFLRRQLASDERPNHLTVIGVAKEVWDYLEAKAGPVKLENPVRGQLRRVYRGASPAAETVRRDAFEAGMSSLPTLLTGETGTGKSLLAECIHVASGRPGAFVAVNCATLAPTVEAQLFGYVVGAFTGAIYPKPGVFELAHTGTLFLDEIGFLPLDEQAKFLRVLEERAVTRMGSTKSIPVDVKIVTATTGNLRAMIAAREFLPELIARLNGVQIRIPALRDRRADIPDLVEAYWPESVTELPAPLLEMLTRYDWPLNVRQLCMVTVFLKERKASGNELTRDLLLQRLAQDDELLRSRTFSFASEHVTAPGAIVQALDAYDAVRQQYERLAHVVQTIVARVVREVTHIGNVRSHTMTRAELAERLHEPHADTGRAAVDVDADRCVVTVKVLTPNQKQDVYVELKRYFEIHGDLSPEIDGDFDSKLLRPWSYVARIDGGGAERLRRLGFPLPPDLIGLECRVELRTELEDIKATVEEQFATAGVPMPASWRAKLREQEGALSTVQQLLETLHHQFKSLTGSYGTYVSEEEARRKLAVLQKTLEVAPDVEIAARAGRLAVVLGQWSVAIGILQTYAGTKNARILRELGAALCKEHDPETAAYQTGVAYLEEACTRAPRDPDACSRFAGALRRRGDVERARGAYERALEIDPANPYALSGLIHTTLMLRPDEDVVTRMRGAIAAATERCHERVSASVDMPWALLDLGKFLVLAGQVRAGLEAYARAIGRTTSPWMLSTTMRSLRELGQYQCVPPELALAERLLAVGSTLRFHSEDAVGRLPVRPRRNVRCPVVLVVDAGDELHEDRRSAFDEIVGKGLAALRGTTIEIGAAPADDAGPLGLDAWIDVAAARVSPSQVLLLVLGEHERVSVACELALAVGARVAVVPVDDEGETPPAAADDRFSVVRDAAALSAMVAALA